MTRDPSAKPFLWLRRRCRTVILAGIGFVAGRPLLHRCLALAYPLVPGLQARLRRIGSRDQVAADGVAAVVPAPAPAADPNAPYLFQPGVAGTPGTTVTVEELYHLARALPAAVR